METTIKIFKELLLFKIVFRQAKTTFRSIFVRSGQKLSVCVKSIDIEIAKNYTEGKLEEALIEMYLAGVSVRRVEDISEALWGSRVSASTISDLNQKAYVHIEEWRQRPLSGRYPYIYIDEIYLKRNWGGEFENVSILVAIGVDEDGYREIIGATEGMEEDKESWRSFLVWLKERGLDGVKLVVGDKNLGMCKSVHEVFPDAKYQRCTVHFYRNIMSSVPRNRFREVAYEREALSKRTSNQSYNHCVWRRDYRKWSFINKKPLSKAWKEASCCCYLNSSGTSGW